LNPIVSDLCIMARTEGMRYTDLINEVLCLATSRYAQEYKGNDNRHALQEVPLNTWEAMPVEGL
jgi:hypothetical protein